MGSGSEDTELARGFSVADYRSAVERKDRAQIARAIRDRFLERYILPVTDSHKHGFAIMAVSCLMIEAFQSMREGLESSDGKSEAIFGRFFEAEREAFGPLSNNANDFYKNVRCAIFHQAETTKGWRVRRDGPLFDEPSRTLNATRFLETSRSIVNTYCESLSRDDWDSVQWQNVRMKFGYLCSHCVLPI